MFYTGRIKVSNIPCSWPLWLTPGSFASEWRWRSVLGVMGGMCPLLCPLLPNQSRCVRPPPPPAPVSLLKIPQTLPEYPHPKPYHKSPHVFTKDPPLDTNFHKKNPDLAKKPPTLPKTQQKPPQQKISPKKPPSHTKKPKPYQRPPPPHFYQKTPWMTQPFEQSCHTLHPHLIEPQTQGTKTREQ